jgi:hypothetical protein
MRLRKLTLPGVVFLLLVSVGFAQDQYDFDKAVYIKPVEGSKGQPVQGILRLDSTKKVLRFIEKQGGPPAPSVKYEEVLSMKYEAVRGLLYENTEKPRYAASLVVPPLVFTKAKKHYLTIDYLDAAGAPQYAIVQLDKSNFQEALTRIESETGKKAERP